MANKKQLFDELFGSPEEHKDNPSLVKADKLIEEAILLGEGIAIDPETADEMAVSMTDAETFASH